MKLLFTKMHGAGNDFVFLNDMDGALKLDADIARKLCDRRFGIGADQLLLVRPSTKGDFRMDIYNADGGLVEMCGNGIRCFAKYVRDKRLTGKKKLGIETLAGMIKPEIISEDAKGIMQVKVDMGEPVLDGRLIPANADGKIIDKPLAASGKQFLITAVSMGNPHCVIEVGDVKDFPVTDLGPQIENHPFFPQRTNVEFIQFTDRKHIVMRVWERGSGETLACGTGACGAAVASILRGKAEREVTVHLRGGDLVIHWDEKTNHVFMTGPAVTSFEGVIELQDSSL